MREDYSNYPEKKFLTVEALARRESLPPAVLTDWCESGEVAGRQIKDKWFVDLADWELKAHRLFDKARSAPSVARSPLLLATALVLFVVMFATPPLRSRFRTENVSLGAAVSVASRTLIQNSAQTRMALVYGNLWIELNHFWRGAGHFVQTIGDNLNYFGSQAIDAWRGFFDQEDIPKSETAPLLTLDALTLETLKATIKSELLRELGRNASTNGNSSPTSTTAPGLVVLPASGDPLSDEKLKLELKNTFSDQVEVEFDSSGEAGIITPIFQSGRGDNYLFILTPLKRRP